MKPFAVSALTLLIFVVSGSNAGAQNRQGKLIPSDLQEGEFGWTVSVSGNTAVVGAVITMGVGGPIRGAAYVFERDQGGADEWGQVAKLVPDDPASETLFGTSVAISGDTVIVGSPIGDPPVVLGSAYIFHRHQGGLNAWGQVARVTASRPDYGPSFGYSVSISGDTAVVGGNSGDTTPETTFPGTVYVYSRNYGGANAWGEIKTLMATDGGLADLFGSSVFISGARVIVAAANSAYIFDRNRGGPDAWGEVAKLTAPAPSDLGSFPGAAVISGDTVVIGGGPGALGQGVAYVFGRSAGDEDEWRLIQALEPRGVTLIQPYIASGFGRGGIAIDGDTLIVGANSDDENGLFQSGSAFVFSRNHGGENAWGQIAKLAASDGHVGAQFGASLAISGAIAIVGAPGAPSPVPVGSAYVCDLEQVNSRTGTCRLALPSMTFAITSLTADSVALWPPNGRMVPVSLAVVTSDDSAACRIAGVETNEFPARPGPPEWAVTGPLTLTLRAERNGSGNGRVYTIAVTCTNATNLNVMKTVTVSVSHDRRK